MRSPRALLAWYESQHAWHLARYHDCLSRGLSRARVGDWHFAQLRWYARRAFYLQRWTEQLR